jgi:superfamily II DNA/RNA helicase
MEGRDVVAMARTGSGKTACFLIPLFEKLKTRVPKSGARALILSPTRELALQVCCKFELQKLIWSSDELSHFHVVFDFGYFTSSHHPR